MEISGKKTPTQSEEMINQRYQFKLDLRKQKIQEAINLKRQIYTNPIAGYNLSAHMKKNKKYKKKCWKCGKSGHTRNFCPSMKITQIRRLIWEMIERIETLEKALNQSKKKAEELKRKHQAKIKKKKQKKHQETVQAMNKAVTIHLLLLKNEHMIEEGYAEPKHLLKATEFHQSLPNKLQTRIEKQYKRLFGGTIREHMLDAIDDDELFDPELQLVT